MENKKLFRNALGNRNKGQVLIESLFLSLIVGCILIAFNMLIDYQNSRKERFYHTASKPTKKLADPNEK